MIVIGAFEKKSPAFTSVSREEREKCSILKSGLFGLDEFRPNLLSKTLVHEEEKSYYRNKVLYNGKRPKAKP